MRQSDIDKLVAEHDEKFGKRIARIKTSFERRAEKKRQLEIERAQRRAEIDAERKRKLLEKYYESNPALSPTKIERRIQRALSKAYFSQEEEAAMRGVIAVRSHKLHLPFTYEQLHVSEYAYHKLYRELLKKMRRVGMLEIIEAKGPTVYRFISMPGQRKLPRPSIKDYFTILGDEVEQRIKARKEKERYERKERERKMQQVSKAWEKVFNNKKRFPR